MSSPGTRSGRGAWLVVGLIIGFLIGAGASFAILPQNNRTGITTSLPSSATTARATGSSPVTTPSPVAVSLNPKTTAVLMLDYVFCYRLTGCNSTLPALQALLKNARSAGAPIIFTRTPVPREIANQSGEAVITNDIGPDKYYNTSLANILQSKGIKTVVIAGIAANGALLYTAQESCVRRYTVVVPVDIVIGSDFVQAYVPFQLLNGPGCGNPSNTPLSPAHATISTTSSITFKSGG